jgi:hypothetical protein
MNAMRSVVRKIPAVIAFSLLRRYFHNSCFALFVLAVLAVSFSDSAVAGQKFALIGTWEHTEATFYRTVTFKPNGTTYSKIVGVNSISEMRGTYKATGASSWVGQIQTYRMCGSGGACGSCPRRPGDSRFNNGCESAKIWGITPGVNEKTSVQMQGPDTFVINGVTWRRVHCPSKPFC